METKSLFRLIDNKLENIRINPENNEGRELRLKCVLASRKSQTEEDAEKSIENYLVGYQKHKEENDKNQMHQVPA